ncbi:MAG: MBL fold metallo-hydrolase [Chloroflexota bacterium]
MEQQSSSALAQPHVQRLVVGPFGTNCYIVRCPVTDEAVIIDPAANPDLIVKTVADCKPQRILLTHGHMDHVGAVTAVKARLGLPVGLHRLDAGLAQIAPDFALENEAKLPLGQLAISVMHTPGHTPGSVTFLVGREAFVGDLIFPGGPGVTRTPVDFDRILKSITGRILTLPPDTRLHPGHGEGLTVAKAREEVADFLRRPAKPHLCGEVRWDGS